jgi:ArsR family transcriptional regulator, virulence genes transcriptional regulator
MDVAFAQKMKKSARLASELLAALANDSRLMILCHLVHGEKRVFEIAALVGLSQSALSQHLAKLRALGLVASRRDGQCIYYRIASKEALRVLETLHEVYCDPARI